MSNSNLWGSTIVPQNNVPTYGKKKTEEERVGVNVNNKVENKPTAKPVIIPSNPAGGAWDKDVNILGEVEKAEKETKALPQWDTGAKFGIRNSLQNDFGVSGDRIGYKDGNVLLDGKFLMKAKNNVDGTTYTDSYDDMVGSLSDYVKNNGLVAIRDYAAASGTAVNINWNEAEKTVSLNGVTIKPAAVINGKAYIPKSQLDEILAQSRNTSGTSYKNIYDEVKSEQGAGVDKAYSDYVDSEDFSYNPESDPAYLAYMKVVNKAAEDEYNKNVAAARFRTGGVGSTAQMQQAAAIREDAVDNIAAARAQFEQDAYNRYVNDQALKRDKYDVARGRMFDDIDMMTGINEKDKQDFYNAQEFDRTMQATDEELGRVKLENDLYETYGPGYAEMEYGDTVRNYKISESFAPILAQLEVNTELLKYVNDKESFYNALVQSGYTPERIESIMDVLDAYNYYING